MKRPGDGFPRAPTFVFFFFLFLLIFYPWLISSRCCFARYLQLYFKFSKIELTSHFLQIVEEGRVHVGRDCYPLPYVGPSKQRKCYRFSLRFSTTVSHIVLQWQNYENCMPSCMIVNHYHKTLYKSENKNSKDIDEHRINFSLIAPIKYRLVVQCHIAAGKRFVSCSYVITSDK